MEIGSFMIQWLLHRKKLAAASAIFVVLLTSFTAKAKSEEASWIHYGKRSAPGVAAESVAISYGMSSPPSVPPNSLPASKAPPSDSPSSWSRPSDIAKQAPPPAELLAFGCSPRAGTFRFSGVYGRCEIDVPTPLPEADEGPDRRRRRRPSLEELQRTAIDRAIALAPSPRIRIAPGRVGLTGLPSFFWLHPEPQGISATAGVHGVTVTATAAPSQFWWRFGDGEERVTEHSGRPWTRRRAGSIKHTYETKGMYEVGSTIVWTASWSINGGPSRPLGSFTTSRSVDYPAREVIAFLSR